MNDRPRVVMPNRQSVLDEGDIAVNTPRTGVRYTMDFAEDAHHKLGEHAIVVAVERLGQEIAYDRHHQIRRTVESYLMDREWAEPLIKEALREAVKEHVRGIFGFDQ